MRRKTNFVKEQDIDIITKTPGAYDFDTGEEAAATEVASVVIGNIQPISGKTLQRLPEGRRTRHMKTMYVRAELDVSVVLVLYKGSRYEIESEDDWDDTSAALPHYKYTMSREGDHDA